MLRILKDVPNNLVAGLSHSCTIEYMRIPRYKELSQYVLRAVYELGGSAPVGVVEQKVADLLNLSPKERSKIHNGTSTELSYHVAWARFNLKKKGLLASAKRGFSVLSEQGRAALDL